MKTSHSHPLDTRRFSWPIFFNPQKHLYDSTFRCGDVDGVDGGAEGHGYDHGRNDDEHPHAGQGHPGEVSWQGTPATRGGEWSSRVSCG